MPNKKTPPDLERLFIFMMNRLCLVVDNRQLAITRHSGAGGNKLADDDVFFQPDKRIDFAFDSGVSQNSGSFLETRRAKERIRRQ